MPPTEPHCAPWLRFGNLVLISTATSRVPFWPSSMLPPSNDSLSSAYCVTFDVPERGTKRECTSYLPPMKPLACTKIQPAIPDKSLSSSSRIPRQLDGHMLSQKTQEPRSYVIQWEGGTHASGRALRLSKLSGLTGTAWTRQWWDSSLFTRSFIGGDSGAPMDAEHARIHNVDGLLHVGYFQFLLECEEMALPRVEPFSYCETKQKDRPSKGRMCPGQGFFHPDPRPPHFDALRLPLPQYLGPEATSWQHG
jgi:hypothetical protein